MGCKGFSLIELIIVMTIAGILLAVATLDFSAWQRKYNIAAQVKEMLVDFNDVRTRTIATKKVHRVILNPTSYSFRRYSSEFDAVGTQVFSKNLKYSIQQFSSGSYSAFNNTTLTFNERGYTMSLLTIAVGVGLGQPAYNCLGIHTARVNMGRINGNACEYQ